MVCAHVMLTWHDWLRYICANITSHVSILTTPLRSLVFFLYSVSSFLSFYPLAFAHLFVVVTLFLFSFWIYVCVCEYVLFLFLFSAVLSPSQFCSQQPVYLCFVAPCTCCLLLFCRTHGEPTQKSQEHIICERYRMVDWCTQMYGRHNMGIIVCSRMCSLTWR